MTDASAPALSAKSLEVFCAYSHKDELLRNELEKHVSVLKRRGVVSVWHDRRIQGGTEWAEKIDQHLNSADIILLLVSSDFIASDYCYDKEMTRAMERHELGEARVIPVMLRPCDWDGAPFFKLQGLPTDMKAVTRWISQDEAFTDIAVGIRRVAEDLRRTARKPATVDNSHRVVPESLPSKAHRAKSPRRDPYSLLLWGPRIEVEIGPPFFPNSKGALSLSPNPTDSRGFWKMPALIDTGAGLTVLTPEAVSRIGLQQVDVIRVARAGGVSEDVGVYAAAFRFPRYRLPAIGIARVICCALPEQPIQCLLGRDVLSHWRFSYDGGSGEWIIEARDLAVPEDPI